ncbi:two-component system, sensor histidine kinase [Gammaproteobacteria bacterium]|nr:two-component system, sensor histidine kinase [Gammaproteobacteria bacterium]
MASPAEARPLRALLVATDELEVLRLRDLVAQMPVRVEVEWARSFEAGFSRMTSSRYDAHLVAGRLGERSGVELLRAYQEAGGGAPVIVLGRSGDRILDLDAMEAGASGFLALDRLDPELFERSIRYAVDSRRQEVVLRHAREELRESVEERSASLETMNAALAAEVVERRRAELKLRDVDRRKNEFLATLAHELRNPLAPIRHATEILARLGPPESERTPAAEARKVIERQVSHLVRLIDDLLDISRISYGKVGLRPEPVSLASIVESALEAVRPLLFERGHVLEEVLPEAPILLNGDPVRLAQILTNLLKNAAWYTEPGGRVRVEACREGPDAVVRVVDSGIGIPADALERIFTMFGQGTEVRAVDHGGLGIGLALAKKLAELHAGSLTAASDGPGKGSAFTLRLPLEAGARTSPEARPAAPANPFPRQRVLVVDDNVDAARTLADLLALDGHESHVAHDGPSAVEAAHRLRPDAAILDLGLPGFSGLEVARRLREDPSLSGIFLVALSGWVQPEDLVRSREAGFDHHLAKPVGTATLELLFKLARTGPRTT